MQDEIQVVGKQTAEDILIHEQQQVGTHLYYNFLHGLVSIASLWSDNRFVHGDEKMKLPFFTYYIKI
jgi:hypothetical protein